MRMIPSTFPSMTSAGLAAALAALAAPALAHDHPGLCHMGYVLGDADGDGILSLTEAETLWGAEFAELDADADGRVTADEYAACLGHAAASAIAPRNVSATGSGPLDDQGLTVELEGLADGSLTLAEYMDAALSAFDGAGNEEDNQLEWARAFVWLFPEESETDVRALGRDGYAARAAALFRRLDTDRDGALTPEEWVGDTSGEGVAWIGSEEEFLGLDADASGDVTLTEYSDAGAARFERARGAALAAGWEDLGGHAAGIGTEAGEGAVVATGSEGLTGEDGTASAGPATDAQGAADPVPDAAGDAAGTAAGPTGGGGVPAFHYRFGLGG